MLLLCIKSEKWYSFAYADFTLTCDFGLPGPNGPLSVSCTVVGGEVDTVICNYDNGQIVEECMLFMLPSYVYSSRHLFFLGALDNVVSFARFTPGPHSLDIIVNSTDGQVAIFGPISFIVPQPLGKPYYALLNEV